MIDEEKYLLRSFVLYHLILLTIYILSVFTIFPIFIHLTRINRQKDRESSVFLITNHIYKITIYSQFLIVLCAISFLVLFFLAMCLNESEYAIITSIIRTITFYFVLITYNFMQFIIPIQNLLIFLLALQRCLIYFFADYEKYLVPSEKRFDCIIKWLYSISILGNLIYFIYWVKCMHQLFYSDETCDQQQVSITSSIIYIILDFLVMFSSIFYIFILVSVRNITRNASNFMKTRPEKVIIYQTLVLLFVKLLSIPTIFFFLHFLMNQDLQLNGFLNVVSKAESAL
ncbi:unnamed protein product [Caenorhabditis angaria]|uniref:G-protein coupled receptors family 1 profile domain-containing protein n=1 Tax=Caenorhabditis angaria TaxID=860376 RepID=A0A9P1N5E3_9PELO|nr:unnamed protein product [Caenorhabditis angaria]